MKFIVFSFLLLVAGNAMAWPNVGDTADYDLMVTVQGQQVPGELESKTTEIDPDHDQITVHQTLSIDGQLNSQDQTAKLSDFRDAARAIPSIVSNCAHNGGIPDRVTTPAGTFAACKVTADDNQQTGFVWYADVVFGWVKSQGTNRVTGLTREAALKSYRIGR